MQRIDLKSGKITYNEFRIHFDIPFSEQLDSLLEDLVQIEYEDGYLIDLGWYPEFDAAGRFIVQLIKDYNWEKPIYIQKSRDVKQLKEILVNAINRIKR